MSPLRRFLRAALIALTSVCLLGVPAPAAAAKKIDFNRDVRPILSEHCVACHGPDAGKREADLRLDTREGLFSKIDNIFPVVPGKPEASEVMLRILSHDKDEMMPPPKANKPLKPEQIAVLREWIAQGAEFKGHWSFIAPVKPALPSGSDARKPVDAFIHAALQEKRLAASPEADRATLVRRISFALTGLPPSLKEVDAFLADTAPDAYDKMVDRYLASPHYGEQMARHWLDLARYGDTHGMHLDNERSMWPYRDWVVRAFNANMPFDQFTVEQLAGDLLPTPTTDQLVATGFNRCNVTTGEGGSIDAELIFRYAVDRTATTAETWMGLTAGCAQCHDHKFDPLSQKEFYSLYAFFYSAADPALDGNLLLTAPTVQIVSPEQQRQIADLTAQIAAGEKALADKVATVAYTDPADVQPRPAVTIAETVWIEDDVPPGGKIAGTPGATQWVEAPVFSGKRALRRTDKALAQDVCEPLATPLEVPAGAKIFTYVFLEPADLPRAIMVQFHKAGWMHRAVWGDYDVITFGAAGTPERVNMGALPVAGKWVRLEVDAAKLGLKASDKITGIAFTQFGGTVTWDKLGVSGSSDPAADPQRSLAAWLAANTGNPAKELPQDVRDILQKPAKDRAPEQTKRVREHYLGAICAETKPQLGALTTELAARKKQRDDLSAALPATFIMRDLPQPRQANVMLRGQYDKPGEPVARAVPAILPSLGPVEKPNRLDLAKWLVAPEHPLTSRVVANRLWQQFFGTGLVKTSGDFGAQGEPPTHPDLLDWLAVNFRESSWDVKALVRLIVTSSAFRQDGRVTPELLKIDPENRLLARGPRLRLDAEEVRDNALFASGLIKLTMGGKGVKPYQPPNIWEPLGFVGSNTASYKQDHGDALYRRSIYTFLKRTAPAPFLANFDAPNREQACTRRERSNTPLQALQLMNDVQHFEAARALAERLITEGGKTPAERIAFGCRTVLARPPTAEEVAIVQDAFTQHLAKYQAQPAAAKAAIRNGESVPKPGLPEPELAAWTMVANLLLNLDETITRN